MTEKNTMTDPTVREELARAYVQAEPVVTDKTDGVWRKTGGAHLVRDEPADEAAEQLHDAMRAHVAEQREQREQREPDPPTELESIRADLRSAFGGAA